MIYILSHECGDVLIMPKLDRARNCLYHSTCSIRPYEIADDYLLCTTWDEFNTLIAGGYTPNMIRRYKALQG